METLGSLCDKLTIIKLKQFHCDDSLKNISLSIQEGNLVKEINQYIVEVFSGNVDDGLLTFESNKIFKDNNRIFIEFLGDIGELFSSLAEINCKLWHEQENVYDFAAIPDENKNDVVQNLATLNLQRNFCIDKINTTFKDIVLKDR